MWQGHHSFSTMIFHDFSMTKKMNFHDLSAQHIFSKWTTHDLWMLTRIKIYFQLLVNQSVSKTSETTNRMIFTETKILVHFYKKFQDIIIIFHDFPWPWLFSVTFQACKMVLLNSMTFQEVWSPCMITSIAARQSPLLRSRLMEVLERQREMPADTEATYRRQRCLPVWRTHHAITAGVIKRCTTVEEVTDRQINVFGQH